MHGLLGEVKRAMFSLWRKYLRENMIQLHKMFSDCDYLDVGTFFILEGTTGLGHDKKKKLRKRCGLDLQIRW